LLHDTNFRRQDYKLYVPDRKGNFTDIVLGYDNIDDCIKVIHISAICVDVLIQIADGKFIIDGNTYQLPINNGLILCMEDGKI